MPSSGDGLLSSTSSVGGLPATLGAPSPPTPGRWAPREDCSRISCPRSRSSEMSDPETNWEAPFCRQTPMRSSQSKMCDDLSGRLGSSANDWIFCVQNWITSFLWVSVLQASPQSTSFNTWRCGQFFMVGLTLRSCSSTGGGKEVLVDGMSLRRPLAPEKRARGCGRENFFISCARAT
ncbi:unnamed protein product, partial [Ixodes persulcatus]